MHRPPFVRVPNSSELKDKCSFRVKKKERKLNEHLKALKTIKGCSFEYRFAVTEDKCIMCNSTCTLLL